MDNMARDGIPVKGHEEKIKASLVAHAERLRMARRALNEDKIADPCPSCSHHALFIGAGGHLTCGNLKCKEPGVTRAIGAVIEEARAELNTLKKRINTPEIVEYMRGVQEEAVHQQLRFPDAVDKYSDEEWLAVLIKLGTKAAQAERYADRDKALHHCITVGALASNWHKSLLFRALRKAVPA